MGDELADKLLLLHGNNDGVVESSQATLVAQRQQHTHPTSAG